MMTKFKSVSAQTPKLVGKNLAKVKGGDATLHHCNQQLIKGVPSQDTCDQIQAQIDKEEKNNFFKII